MAVTKIWKVKDRLDITIDYAVNGEKNKLFQNKSDLNHLFLKYEKLFIVKLEKCSKANIIKYTPELIQVIKQMDEYSNQVTFLCKNKIQTEKDLIDFEKSINDKIKPLKCERESLWKKHKRAKTDEEKENIEQQLVAQ